MLPELVGTCWPTNSLPSSLSLISRWGSASTVASVCSCRNWMRKSMLIVLLTNPVRRLVRAEATALVVEEVGGLLTADFPPKPDWYWPLALATKPLSLSLPVKEAVPLGDHRTPN